MEHEPDTDIPGELRAFLHSCIESVDQVELLLLMRGTARTRTARDLASELRTSVAAARHDAETLAARGLLAVSVGDEIAYRYAPKSEDLKRYADLLAAYYVTGRRSVIRFVATESRLSMKRFSEAFRLRTPEKS